MFCVSRLQVTSIYRFSPFFNRSAAFLLPAYVGRISLPNSSITAKSSEYFPGEFWLGATEDWTEAGVAEEEPTAEIQNFLISKRIRRE